MTKLIKKLILTALATQSINSVFFHVLIINMMKSDPMMWCCIACFFVFLEKLHSIQII